MSATVPLAPVHDASSVARLLGIAYTAEQIAGFGPPPNPLDGFVTFFDPGWSILQLRDFIAGNKRVFYPQEWYDCEKFAKIEEIPRYRQLRIWPVTDSLLKTFHEQLTLLPAGEEVPRARDVVAALVIHFLATGQHVLRSVYARCADQTLRGTHVDVGLFDSDGLIVIDWLGHRHGIVGLVSARKI